MLGLEFVTAADISSWLIGYMDRQTGWMDRRTGQTILLVYALYWQADGSTNQMDGWMNGQTNQSNRPVSVAICGSVADMVLQYTVDLTLTLLWLLRKLLLRSCC